ncbi:MAG TPA: 50S ribosomal protein L11 methyltransferase [Pyrinomonadaceae bacterium]|nr:50S ribosomal protein L11 methyltransferase [Pyrinomonadaceae bacterium]
MFEPKIVKGLHINPKIEPTLLYHASMLGDGIRNWSFFQALQKYVTKETSVLDIGSGVGVWAILAAKLGAKRVVAIEKNEILIPIIQRHIIENDVVNQVEVINVDSRDFKSKEKFDLIISETIGNLGFEENIAGILLDAKNRFLSQNGLIIPQAVSLMCVPINFVDSTTNLPDSIPFSCDYFKSLAVNFSQYCKTRNKLNFLSEPKVLLETDLLNITIQPEIENLKVSWFLPDVSQVNGFALFARAQLTEEIILDTFESESWSVMLFEFEPFEVKVGEIEFDLTSKFEKKFWNVSLLSSPDQPTRSYSPVFPSLRLV